MSEDNIVALIHNVLFFIFFCLGTSLAPLITLSSCLRLMSDSSSLYYIVTNFEDGFFVFEIFENVGIHLDANFKAFIENWSKSVVENA
jgi:hypothetical protein